MRILAWPAFANRRSNPCNWQLYRALMRQGVRVEEYSVMSLLLGRYAVWHLHWPDFALNVRCPLVATLGAYRRVVAGPGLLPVAEEAAPESRT